LNSTRSVQLLELFLCIFLCSGCAHADNVKKENQCVTYKKPIDQLETIVSERHDAVARIFSPCPTNCPLEAFGLEAEERRKRFPETYKYYELAEADFIRAVTQSIETPKSGKLQVEIISGAWRLAMVELHPNGAAISGGGEPGSVSLEIVERTKLQGNEGPIDRCNSVWFQQGMNGVTLAKPVYTEEPSKRKLGEIQILIQEGPPTPK